MAEIVPAILTNDVSDFRKKYAELFALSHFFTKLHVDFADGEFVPNKTVMPKDLLFLKSTPLTLMAHFMAFEPQKYFADAKQAGFAWVMFHYEALEKTARINEAIEAAKKLNLQVGLVLNPETPIGVVEKFANQINLIQLMGIHPGFQGREFMDSTTGRIIALRRMAKNVIISVDGGVKPGIAGRCVKAGASLIVAGSSILRATNEKAAMEALQSDLEETK